MNLALEINALNFSYPDGQPALRGINLQVQPGERIALVGPNGAGKSTLLLHLNGILNGNGMVRVSGMEITRQNLPRIRALVGLVFQSPDDQLFSPTVYEDVAYGPIYQGLNADEVCQRVEEALRAVHMLDYIQRVPYHLSVGEKKRIAIASVLSMQPEILAFDEPTAGMDPRARRSLIELLHELPQTLIIATHDLEMVRTLLPRTVVMDRGQIVADGPSREILSDPAFLDEHGLQ